MGKQITMYELLGLVKDGKAPKKIKYGDMIFTLENMDYGKEYQCKDDNIVTVLDIDLDCLNDEVEILEEEKKIPEKFKIHSFGDKDENGNFVSSPFPTDEEFMNKINYIIDYLQYLKNKGE